MNTNDRRLFALDAATGKVCAGFGDSGVVDVAKGVTLATPGQIQITSPPVVVHGVVVVGSSIDDNQRVQEITGLQLGNYRDRLMAQVALEIIDALGGGP